MKVHSISVNGLHLDTNGSVPMETYLVTYLADDDVTRMRTRREKLAFARQLMASDSREIADEDDEEEDEGLAEVSFMNNKFAFFVAVAFVLSPIYHLPLLNFVIFRCDHASL